MKSVIAVFAIHLLNPFFAFSQSDAKLSVFTYHPLMHNPAYAMTYDGILINSLYSTQWVGFKGAPKTLFLSGQGILPNPATALGFDIMSDEIGAVQENNFNIDFAYQVKLSETINVSLGLKAGMNNFNVDYNQLTLLDPNENGLADKKLSQNALMIGSGLLVYTEKWAIGFSVPNMIKTKYLVEYNHQIAKKKPYYFINGAYRILVGDEVYVQPNFMTRIAFGAPVSTLVAVNLNWKDKFIGSVNFETEVSMGGFVGFRFLEHFMAGYSYDFSVNDFSKYNTGIHTFILNYRLGDFWSSKCACSL